jgi:hypothetical protein
LDHDLLSFSIAFENELSISILCSAIISLIDFPVVFIISFSKIVKVWCYYLFSFNIILIKSSCEKVSSANFLLSIFNILFSPINSFNILLLF